MTLVALLLGDMAVGAQNVSLVLQVPTQLGAVFSALLLLSVLSAMSWRRYRVQWRPPRSSTSASPPSAPPPASPSSEREVVR